MTQLKIRRRHFRPLNHEEVALVHHALRMLAKYPGNTEADQATRLADEIWERHLARLRP